MQQAEYHSDDLDDDRDDNQEPADTFPAEEQNAADEHEN